ncbi:hypothetical protein [Nocardia aobensis]|uniref:hypothetical protein n=1 Tax=Nocardia aobensis TaxID=257277 RepID=UPI000561106C|nr:hypothetical protein [Nocardia aobensis]
MKQPAAYTSTHREQNFPEAGTGAARLASLAFWAALSGSLVFAIGTVLHPARDGFSIAGAPDYYGLTHDIQAIGLFLQVVSLAAMLGAGRAPISRISIAAPVTALLGTLSWFALILFDGSHNPATAQYAPQIVHKSADFGLDAAIIVIPALILFPVGHAVFGVALARSGAMLWGGLLGVGALLYTIGGYLIFAIGPESTSIQVFEVVGVLPYSLAFAALGFTIRRAAP